MTATVRGISAEGRQGAISLDAKEYTVVYKVTSDDRNDGPSVIRTAFGVPTIGDIYVAGNDVDAAAVVVGKTVTQVSPWEWEVNVTYSTDVGDEDLQSLVQQIDNPLLEPPEITYGFEERRILVPGRYNDPIGPPGDKAWEQGIFAPNGELFEPQPEADYADPVIHVRRNLQTIDPQAIRSLANCVNNDSFDGAEPRQLRLKPITASRKFNKNIGFYWEVHYSIVFRFETWDIQLLNQGHYSWPTPGKPTSVWSTTIKPITYKTVSGEPRLVNLSTNGMINTTSTPTYTRIRFYREVSFGSLNLY